MSYSNASRRAIAVEDVPAPGLSDLAFEGSLRAAGVPFTVSVSRKTGERGLGAVFPQTCPDEAAWEESLADLSRAQGLSDGHTVEAARGRQDEPTADPAVTSRVLRRRG